MAASTMKKNLSLLRALASEIRKSSSAKKTTENLVLQYIVQQNRTHQETSETYCKDREELQNLTKNYLCYLNSLRKYNEIQTYYSGKGEKSIEETAKLVGFKLPHDPY